MYQINNILNPFCWLNDLQNDGLHLTNEGSSLLVINFTSYLNGNINSYI